MARFCFGIRALKFAASHFPRKARKAQKRAAEQRFKKKEKERRKEENEEFLLFVSPQPSKLPLGVMGLGVGREGY